MTSCLKMFAKLIISITFILIIFNQKIVTQAKQIDDCHSSINVLEEVFKTEKLYIENLNIYLKYSEKIIDTLKSLKNNKRIIHFGSELSFAKKLNLQYKINDLLNSNYAGFAKNISRFDDIYKFPTNFDLEGVTRALFRIKGVYNYDIKEIVTGSFLKFNDNKRIKQLKAREVFLIGEQLFNIGQESSLEWFKTAYELYDENYVNLLEKPLNMSNILDFLALSYYQNGNLDEAIKTIKLAISKDPEYEHIQNQLKNYEKIVERLKMEQNAVNRTYEQESYKIGCQGRFKKSPEIIKNLYCMYKNGPQDFLKFAPIKVEIQNVNPYIAVFHDVLYDEEIEILKSLSKALLTRALVFNDTTGESDFSQLRTSKYGWLENDAHPFLAVLNQRISDMTDLEMAESELLQVMNYGTGGHYDIHSDYFAQPKDFSKAFSGYEELGNRIATVLFYMTDVEQGGSTVLPNIKTAVQPVKGTAAFWFNLHPSGIPDSLTRHAACPVVLGSKWVANKWIRYYPQMFVRQCKKDLREFYRTTIQI